MQEKIICLISYSSKSLTLFGRKSSANQQLKPNCEPDSSLIPWSCLYILTWNLCRWTFHALERQLVPKYTVHPYVWTAEILQTPRYPLCKIWALQHQYEQYIERAWHAKETWRYLEFYGEILQVYFSYIPPKFTNDVQLSHITTMLRCNFIAGHWSTCYNCSRRQPASEADW